MHDLPELRVEVGDDKRMHVVGHHAPSLEGVAIFVAMQQRLSDHARTPRIAHEARAQMTIQDVITFLLVRRHRIVEPKDDVLTDAVPVEMREIAAVMPALPAHPATI
jgi:hypothetical protein